MLPNANSLPEYFKNNGYTTVGMGKVFHPGGVSGNNDVKYSWSPASLPYFDAPLGHYPNSSIVERCENCDGWMSVSVDDNDTQDGVIADRAVTTLKTLAAAMKPFFLAVGFHRPHMPEVCGEKYYKMYGDMEQIPLAENPEPPTDVPQVAVQTSTAFREWLGMNHNGPCVHNFSSWNSPSCFVSQKQARQIKRAYWSCTTAVDAMVGKVYKALGSLDLVDSTVVVLWGDHGVSLNVIAIYSLITHTNTLA